jgi:multicomponent Na+:H+ antiporter subunit E
MPADVDFQDMHFIIVALTLYLFWLLLSGHFTVLLLGLGGLSTLLVVWILRRMDRADGEPTTAHFSLGLIGYGTWLLAIVVKSNVDVVRRIWDPGLPIDPRWRRLDTQAMSKVQKTLYANSITLTPGTLTTDVREDHFMVHSLSEAAIEDLKAGEMERRIRRLGL